jgi:Interferon-induced 6-16 family
MQNKAYRLLLIFSLLLVVIRAADSSNSDGSYHLEEKEEEQVKISPKCAAVLLGAGGLGVGLAYTLTPALLCTAGFCHGGVSANSFAAAWQSTMPLVTQGSLFATLQSIAMGGVGVKVGLSGAALGVGTALMFINEFCFIVDETSPDSPLGQIFGASEKLVTTAIQTKSDAADMCDSSETCAAMSRKLDEARTWASSQWSSLAAAAFDKVRETVLHWELETPTHNEEL